MSEIELHRKLLGDTVRNAALHDALRKVIKPGVSTVVDVGAGTGFISFLARKLGAKHCTLIEYSDALELARKLARANGITGLSFVKGHSSELEKAPKGDVVISETLGNYALEENLLETLVDARRFVAPGGVLVPGALAQFAAPVIAPRLSAEIDVWRGVGFGLDLAAARDVSLNNMYVKSVAPAEIGAAQRWDRIDFAPRADAPASVRRATLQWPGPLPAVHGFALWWAAELVPGVTLSTAPDAPPTHWQQVYLPLLDAVTPERNERLELTLTSDTRPGEGIRVGWQTRVLRAGKAVATQTQDTRRGLL